MGNKKKNPYMTSYLSLAGVCCLILILLFFYVYYQTVNETQKYYHQKKVQMLADDWNTQFQMLEEIALQISVDNTYQPYFFQGSSYNEVLLLDEFTQYGKRSVLAEECFLYYGGKSIFHSNGKKVSNEVYFKEFSEEELDRIMEVLTNSAPVTRILPLSSCIYVAAPFRTSDGVERSNAVLTFVINHSTLESRFQMVSGGMQGNISLYRNGELLYCNQETPALEEDGELLTASNVTGEYSISYLPQGEEFLLIGRFPIMLMLLLAAAILVMIIANMLAIRSYRPLVELSDKFRKEIPGSEEVPCENALEELNFMMEDLIKHNAVANTQIEQKQKMLRRQVLWTLLEGNYEFDMQQYLERLQISLPGPWFFVITISFEDCAAVSDEMLATLQEEMDALSDEACGEYLYAICNYGKKQISVILSMADVCKKEKMAEYVCEVAGSFGHEPLLGMGNVYEHLSRLSASWLESVDNIYKKELKPDGGKELNKEIYDPEGLRKLLTSLANGDEESAEKGLSQYMKQLETGPVSVLMQQYVFANFLSEITKASRECKVQLSNQCMSLLVSAKNAESFKSAARELIRDFCQKYHQEKDSREKDLMYQIYEYINAHFAEYDLSIEKAAASLGVSASTVREAVFQHTGKMYKDYLIYLRIEYAKELLVKEDLAVAEICQRVGYGNVSYFIKLFKEVTGITPAKYRLGK